MKTQNLSFKDFMMMLSIFLIGFCFRACAQNNCYPAQLPQASFDNRAEHQYRVVTDYLSYDIYGTFSSKLRISGDYTSGLDKGKLRWNNVHRVRIYDEKAEFPYGDSLSFMNGFSYTYEQDITSPDFFRTFPFDDMEARNLVWDMAGMEFFAWSFSSVLQLNVPYHAKEANGSVDLSGLGQFTNRDIVLTWKGMTEVDGNQLAIVDYRVMNNPLDVNIDMGTMKMATKGRSHYWGTIWVDCTNTCIDHIELFEDVVMEMQIGNSEKQLLDVVREMKVTKIY